MLFAAVTDHRYIQIGHPLDFTNKAFETLDIIGWESAEQVLSSLVGNYAARQSHGRIELRGATRSTWSALVEAAFAAICRKRSEQGSSTVGTWHGRDGAGHRFC